MSNKDSYVTRQIELTVTDLEDILNSHDPFESFLDIISNLHSNTGLLIDISWKEVSTMALEVTGDVSEAKKTEEFI